MMCARREPWVLMVIQRKCQLALRRKVARLAELFRGGVESAPSDTARPLPDCLGAEECRRSRRRDEWRQRGVGWTDPVGRIEDEETPVLHVIEAAAPARMARSGAGLRERAYEGGVFAIPGQECAEYDVAWIDQGE